jgi:alkaline phosphatase D
VGKASDVTALTFEHGVASGDPEPHGLLLWTRVSGASDAVQLHWVVARDVELRDVVRTGQAEATPQRDWTVHVEVDGLEAASTYHYGFSTPGASSPVGRTRTLPDGPVDRLRIGVVSCADLSAGWFNAYARLADRDLDLVVHLGDYVYAHRETPERRPHHPARECRSLADYRARHASYKRDPDLQRLHRSHAVVAVWDDHDIAGNAWRDGARGHDPSTEGPWAERRAAATRAWLEWVPVRRPDDHDPDRIWRHVPLGDLGELVLLDTRLYARDEQLDSPVAAERFRDPSRDLLGERQTSWLEERLRERRARWLLLANQVMFSPLHVPAPNRLARRMLERKGFAIVGRTALNADQWDGYPHARRRLLELLASTGTRDAVVLSGDIHTSWAAEGLRARRGDPGAVEVVTPSATAENYDEMLSPPMRVTSPLAVRLVRWWNKWLRFGDVRGHGYVVLDVSAERVQADWWHVGIEQREEHERWARGLVLRPGTARFEEAARPAEPSG